MLRHKLIFYIPVYRSIQVFILTCSVFMWNVNWGKNRIHCEAWFLTLLHWLYLPCVAQVGVIVHGGSTAVPGGVKHVLLCISDYIHHMWAAITHQVATPSLARTRGSLCLVRLLKTFNPVSNPPGFVHLSPWPLVQGPAWTDRAAPRSRRRTPASLIADRADGLHMALWVHPAFLK